MGRTYKPEQFEQAAGPWKTLTHKEESENWSKMIFFKVL